VLENENNNWLGRAQFPDALYDGSYNEFVIHDNALTAAQILSSFNAGPAPAPGPTLIVDRATGSITIQNTTGSAQNLLGYTVSSTAGGLLTTPTWDPIAPASGWTTQSNTVSELREQGGTVQTLTAGGGSIALGYAWNSSPFEDLTFTFTLQGGTPTLGAVQYTGNGGVAYTRSDLDTDGDLDAADWSLFLVGNATNISSLSQVGRYLKGDFNNDGFNNHADFLTFRSDYIAANGAAAFAALTAVPEPATWLLVGLVLLVGAAYQVRSRRLAPAVACACVAIVLAAVTNSTDAALRHRYSFTTNANDSVGGANGMLVDTGSTPNATFSGGQLDLTLNPDERSNALAEGAFVDLPNGIVSAAASAGTSGAVSFSWWFSIPAYRQWQRLGDFGASQGGEGVSDGAFFDGGRNIFVTTSDGRGPNFGVSAYNSVNSDFNSAAGPNLGASAANVQLHATATYDLNDTNGGANPNGTMRMYLNGALFSAAPLQVGLNLNTFTNNNNWLGRSQFNDNIFVGKFNEFRIYDTALTPAEVLFNEAVGPDVAQPAGDVLSLEVNKTTGQVTLKSNINAPITFNYYKIGSTGGALSTSGWNSLDDKEGGDAPGLGWDESGGSDANELIEFVLPTAGASLAANATTTLGSAFNTAIFGSGNNGDLTFEFGTLGGAILTGSVSYVTSGGGIGDYNGNGTVDAADYTLWRDANGTAGPLTNRDPANTGNIGNADYLSWKNRFGNTSAVAVASAVPEPHAIALFGVVVCGVLLRRDRQN
jgi:hypothetical protein